MTSDSTMLTRRYMTGHLYLLTGQDAVARRRKHLLNNFLLWNTQVWPCTDPLHLWTGLDNGDWAICLNAALDVLGCSQRLFNVKTHFRNLWQKLLSEGVIRHQPVQTKRCCEGNVLATGTRADDIKCGIYYINGIGVINATLSLMVSFCKTPRGNK